MFALFPQHNFPMKEIQLNILALVHNSAPDWTHHKSASVYVDSCFSLLHAFPKQVVLVVMGIYTVMVMEQTLQLWAQPYSTMGWVVDLAMRLSVWMNTNGAYLVPFWLQQPISVHQIMPFLAMLVDGATLPFAILTFLNLLSSTLHNTELELSLLLIEGMVNGFIIFGPINSSSSYFPSICSRIVSC